MSKSVPLIVSKIRETPKPVLDYSTQKSVSYSQISTFINCPKAWELKQVRGITEFKPSVHTTFGTAIHEVIQEWLTVMYQETVKKSLEMDLGKMLLDKMKNIYLQEFQKTQTHFSTKEELQEFYLDGIEILNYLKSKRSLYFSTKNVYLIGVEIPLVSPMGNNVFFKGYIDVLLYNSESETFTVIDLKTSTGGWNSETKKDENKIAQLILYKEFLARQFQLDVEKININYIILKRKIPEDPEFPAMGRRIQEFSPPSGKIKRGKILTNVQKFLTEAFTEEGQYRDKPYKAIPNKKNCRFCPFQGTQYCPESNNIL